MKVKYFTGNFDRHYDFIRPIKRIIYNIAFSVNVIYIRYQYIYGTSLDQRI